jgi:pimeloyl-ACP methyl ester carboxylesterase
MNEASSPLTVTRHLVQTDGASVEAFIGEGDPRRPFVCVAHPTDVFGASSIELFADLARAPIACLNAHQGQSGGSSLEAMVDRIEAARCELDLDPWIFWGMSGGGWLAQLYARRHPEALVGIVVESACLCFRERLADPACALSPFFPAWREPLLRAGLLAENAHHEVGANDLRWDDVEGVGRVFRRRGGPALLVAPGPLSAEMEAAMPMLWQFDARPWIASIDLSALVVCGGADPIVPVHRARAVHEALPESTFVVIEAAGHVPSTQRHPEVVAAFDAFVERSFTPRCKTSTT